MTTPVTAAAPAARPPAAASHGGRPAHSAAPFASALDGALTDGRGPARDAAEGGEERSSGDVSARGETGVPDATENATEVATAEVTAALFALALAGSPAAGAATPASGLPTTGLPVDGATVDGTPLVAGAPPAPPAADDAAGGTAVTAPEAPTASTAATASTGPAGEAVGASGRPGAMPTVVGLARALVTPGVPGAGQAGTDGTAPGGHAPGSAPGLTVARAATAGPVPQAADSGGRPGTPGGGTPSVPVTLPTPPGHAASDAFTGRSDQEPTTPGTPAPDPEPVPAPGTTLPAPAPVTAAGPVAAVGPAAGPAAATGNGAALPVSGQLAPQVVLLSSAGAGTHSMTLVLTPENLGPVEVQVTLAQGSLELHLRGAHEMGRAALLEALPELRRDLEAAGLSPSRVEVDADAGGSWLARHAAEQQAQQRSGDRGAQHGAAQDRSGEGSRSWGRPADRGDGPIRPTSRSTSSGVDVRV